MKQLLQKALALFFSATLAFISCRKPETPIPSPHPIPAPGKSQAIRFVLNQLPGLEQAPIANLFARVNILNAKGETVMTDKLLSINFDGKFKTDSIELPAGSYKVARLLIVSGTGNVLFAAPYENSPKAVLVSKALPYAAVLPQASILEIAAQVLAVDAAEKPADFGYNAGEFGPGNIPDENNETTIYLKTVIKVGDVLYDSIPASLTYRSWDAKQEMTTRFISLAAGTNSVLLSSSAIRHELIVKKWGVDYILQLNKDQVKQGELYILGGNKEAKKLKAQLVYKYENGRYLPEAKTGFIYNGNNQLSRIEYYRLGSDNRPFMWRHDDFRYTINNRIDKVDLFDEQDVISGSASYTYNAAGKIIGMEENAVSGVTAHTALAYHHSPEAKLTELNFSYTWSHTSLTMNYYQRYQDGNLVSDNSVTSNQSTETGVYFYDNNINPFVHMGWPNRFLSNQSKNNLADQRKEYFGNYPTVIVESLAYKYDAEGYPVELITRYRSYTSTQYTYTTKTLFTY